MEEGLNEKQFFLVQWNGFEVQTTGKVLVRAEAEAE